MQLVTSSAEGISGAETRIVVHGISWTQYEALLATLGDTPGVRLAYLEGALEIMSPSRLHELLKKNLARLLEVYAMHHDLPFVGYGAATFRKRAKKRGVEPDECYVLTNRDVEPAAPHLAIEVVLAAWSIEKTSIYAGLGVKELWLLRPDGLEIHVLRAGSYRRARKSRLLPKLDLALLLRFVRRTDQTQAAKEYQAALRS